MRVRFRLELPFRMQPEKRMCSTLDVFVFISYDYLEKAITMEHLHFSRSTQT